MFDPALLAAFTRARRHAVAHMQHCLAEGYGDWREDTVTDILCQHASPMVKSVRFNARQEGVNGIDYLCWWRDRSGVAFGMLVQAKNLRRKGAKWAIDFAHSNQRGSQIDLLLESAKRFRLPALYMLYAGPPEHRTGLDCGREHTQPTCKRCIRAGVSVLAGIVAQYLTGSAGRDHVTEQAFRLSTPWEDLVDPARPAGGLRSAAIGEVSARLHAFLMEDQVGAAEIAKRIFSAAHGVRIAQFSTVVRDTAEMSEEMHLRELPADRGHFREPYFVNILQGLRSRVPDYVHAAEQGMAVPSWIRDSVAGILIIDI